MSAPETTPTRRLSLSQIVELLITADARNHSTVTLARDPRGETQIEVKVRTGQADDLATVEQAEAKAQEVYERLRERYPLVAGHENASASLSRNAKGETQIEVGIRTGDAGAETLAEALDRAQSAYEQATRRYPMADGTTRKGGPVE